MLKIASKRSVFAIWTKKVGRNMQRQLCLKIQVNIVVKTFQNYLEFHWIKTQVRLTFLGKKVG